MRSVQQTATNGPNVELNSVLQYPFAWGGILIILISILVASYYVRTLSDDRKAKRIKSYLTATSAAAAFLVFTFLFRVGHIGGELYTTVLGISLGGGLGYKINDIGRERGRQAGQGMRGQTGETGAQAADEAVEDDATEPEAPTENDG